MIRDLLYTQNPYAGLRIENYDLDVTGWNGNDSFFETLGLEKTQLVLEVGSWKGMSAITMAKQMPPGSELVCIDTWLGSVETTGAGRHRSIEQVSIERKNGYPLIYGQFLANVVHSKLTDIITPLPATASTAGRFLIGKNVQADIIYIDASHTYDDVSNDLKLYWNLLKPGGLLIGDDYSKFWPEVMAAVDSFVERYGLKVKFHSQSAGLGEFWKVTKTDY